MKHTLQISIPAERCARNMFAQRTYTRQVAKVTKGKLLDGVPVQGIARIEYPSLKVTMKAINEISEHLGADNLHVCV